MNAPRKIPGSTKGSVNPKVADRILAILDALKNKPEHKGKDQFEILKIFLNYYSVDGNNGLLEEISKKGNLDFDMIKDDGFDIDQIIGDERNTSGSTLHNILNKPSLGTIGKEIEKIVIQKFVEKIRGKVSDGSKANLDKEINNPKSLNEFKSQLGDFFEYGGIDDSTKNEIKKIKITNKDIVDGLVANGKLQEKDIAGDYKNWNVGYKKGFDKIITQQYLGGLKESVNLVEKNLNKLKDTFTNFIPNMGWILDKYPYNKDDVDPEILEKIEQAQENGDKESSDKLSFYAYIELVQNKNETLGNILSKLFQNKFDFSKLDKKDQNELVKEMVDGRLEELKKSGMAGLLELDQNQFDEFVKNIFDLEKNEIKIETANGDIKLGVNKILKGGENPEMADFWNFADAKLPINLDIKILDENKDLINDTAIKDIFRNKISDDGKNINLDANNIGKLLMLYLLGERSFDKIDMNKNNLDKLGKQFDILDKKNDFNNANGSEDGNSDKGNVEGENVQEKTKESAEKENDPFMETWKSIKGYNFLEDKENSGFVEGTRLWIKWADTELPPIDVGGDQWIQLEVKNITKNNFTLKLTGGELAAGSLEGKEFNYPKTKESLDMILKAEAFNGEIYKLPQAKDRDKTIGNIKTSGISGIDGIGVFDELEFKGGKLQSSIIEGNPEITHFGGMETKIDDKSGTENKEIINYEISFKNNGTVDVKYNNYKRNMDYNNFLLFISTKKLKPKTKEDIENDNKEIEKGPTHSGSKLKFFGVANIWHMVTGVGKKLSEGIKKQNEKQDKRFYNIAIGERGIANKLQSVIGWIPGVGDALENIDTEFKNTKDKEVWEKTEEILKKIEGHNDYGRAFESKDYLNEILGSGVSLKDMVLSGKLPGGLSGDKRFVASAVLLAQISKGPGPYHKLGDKRFQGIWVKLLLGEPYYSKFMKDQKEIIEEMKAKQGLYGPGYDAQLASDLARSEMTFLINNIGGRAPGQRLGCIETDKNGKDNAKNLWSDKFSGELESRFNEYISRSKVEEGAGKLDNVNNFTFAYGEYRRFLESGRPTKALPYLKKMAQLAKSPDQIKRFKGAIIYAMLTGFFLHYTLPSTQVWVQSICRSFGFAPGLWAPHIDHQKKIAHFLDIASGKTFYKSTGYNLYNFDQNTEIAYKKFREKFEPRWDTNSNNIDDFLNKGMYEESMKDPTINQLKSSSMESQQEDIDQDVSKNSALIKSYPLSLTKGTIGPISRYDNGTFSGKDNDEIQRAQDAWRAIAKAIPKGPVEKGRLVYTTQRFLNRFDDTFDGSSKEELVRVLATVKKYKNEMKIKGGNISQTFEGIKMGEINNSDIKNILWYMTSGKIFNRKSAPPEEFRNAIEAFEEMFWDNIDNMDENFIEQTFGSENVRYFNKDDSYQLVPRNVFGRITEIGTSQLSDYEKRFKNKYMELNNKGVFINKNMKNIYDNLSRKITCPPLGGEIKQDDKILGYS